jgi:hypothetical protein
MEKFSPRRNRKYVLKICHYLNFSNFEPKYDLSGGLDGVQVLNFEQKSEILGFTKLSTLIKYIPHLLECGRYEFKRKLK